MSSMAGSPPPLLHEPFPEVILGLRNNNRTERHARVLIVCRCTPLVEKNAT